MLSRRWNGGQLLLALLALALLWAGVRAAQAWRQPAPAPADAAVTASPSLAILGTTDPFFPAVAAAGEAPVTSLAFALHGVRNDAATGRGSAIISAADGVQQVYAVGDPIGDGVTLAAIDRDHVLLDRQGSRESLWLDSGGSEVVRHDPMAFDPMPAEPMPADGSGTENLLPASDAPALAAGAAVLPALPADEGGMQ